MMICEARQVATVRWNPAWARAEFVDTLDREVGLVACSHCPQRGRPQRELARTAEPAWTRQGGRQRVSAGCYRAVVAASTMAGSAEAPLLRLTLLVVATNLVYFGTHVFTFAFAIQPSTRGPPSDRSPPRRVG